MIEKKIKLSPNQLISLKNKGKKISALTCYDYSFATIANASEIDVLLVGDSGAMTIFGYPDTTHATIEMMESMTKAVSFGAPDKLIVGDMPFLTNRKGINVALESAERLIRAGASAIKLEGIDGHADVIKNIVQSGIPVMGHLGLTPQHVHTLGYKVQGKTQNSADMIKKQALQLQELGCFAIVLECVPNSLAKDIASSLTIPVIGIGAGKDIDGQILVLQDMLGMTVNLKQKFLRHFSNGFAEIKSIINQYHKEVSEQTYPSLKESYDIDISSKNGL